MFNMYYQEKIYHNVWETAYACTIITDDIF